MDELERALREAVTGYVLNRPTTDEEDEPAIALNDNAALIARMLGVSE